MVKLWYRLGCDPLMFCWKLAQKAVLFIEGWGCWSGEAVQCCTKRAFVARIASAPKKTSNAKWASLVQCGAKLLFHDFMKAAVCRSRFHETWQHRTGMLYAVCRTVCPYVLVIHNSWEFYTHFIPAKIYKLKLYVQYMWSLFHDTPYVSAYKPTSIYTHQTTVWYINSI